MSEASGLYTTRDTCRACGSDRLLSVLDLGEQPLANGFRKPDDTSPEARYPLHLMRCEACELVQIPVVVDPTIMFGQHYPYRSGYSEGWALHCHDLAKEIGPGKRVLEIGCLDGVLLRECRDKGCTVQGIDPSAPQCEIPIRRELFGRDTDYPEGAFDVIVAQNVFGHVDDPEGFLDGIRRALDPYGYAVIECPWVVDMVDGARWDTVYHEHLSYWGLRPLKRLCVSLGLQVSRVKAFPELHGGTMRYYLSHIGHRVDPSVYSTWDVEEMTESDWARFEAKAQMQMVEWELGLHIEVPSRIAAYGASAKLNTFLNALRGPLSITAVFDDTPSKQGLVTPGHHIPVLSPSTEQWKSVNVLLVGAPNWAWALEQRAVASGFTGEVVSLWPKT